MWRSVAPSSFVDAIRAGKFVQSSRTALIWPAFVYCK
jgi:hypothetical protein